MNRLLTPLIRQFNAAETRMRAIHVSGHFPSALIKKLILMRAPVVEDTFRYSPVNAETDAKET